MATCGTALDFVILLKALSDDGYMVPETQRLVIFNTVGCGYPSQAVGVIIDTPTY